MKYEVYNLWFINLSSICPATVKKKNLIEDIVARSIMNRVNFTSLIVIPRICGNLWGRGKPMTGSTRSAKVFSGFRRCSCGPCFQFKHWPLSEIMLDISLFNLTLFSFVSYWSCPQTLTCLRGKGILPFHIPFQSFPACPPHGWMV